MECILYPPSRITNLVVWVVEDATAMEIAIIIEFSLIDGPIAELVFAVGVVALGRESAQRFVNPVYWSM